MIEQGKFLEALDEIKSIAASQNNKLSKEEIEKYLSDMELSQEQMQAVYHYLGTNHVHVEGYRYIPDASDQMRSETAGAEKNNNDKAEEHENEGGRNKRRASDDKKGNRAEINMRLYREELSELEQGMEDAEKMIEAFLRGDILMKNRVIESQLRRVIEIAGKYKKRKVSQDELIAEGNMGLMTGISVVENNIDSYLKKGRVDLEAFYGTIEMEIVHAIESLIDSETDEKDWENAVLAKINLLHEAAKYMTEEIGRVPTKEELSEYTKISIEEISSIMEISEDAKRVAEP